MGRPARPRREADGSEARDRDGLKTIRAVIAYDGTDFYGMQVQPVGRTVAGELERAFGSMLGHQVKITSAGRTDTGVHASGQVVSFHSGAAFPFERFAIAANSVLPADISVRDAEVCAHPFSARFSAVERTYVYAIYRARQRSALHARFAYHVWNDLDSRVLHDAAQPLLGEHDFRSFCGALPQSGPTIRTVRAVEVRESGDMVRIEIRAHGFLHRMVRTIVGTLVECATGRRDPDTIAEILAARDRCAAGLTAPPQGLYLAGVRYDDGFDSFAEPAILPSGCGVKS